MAPTTKGMSSKSLREFRLDAKSKSDRMSSRYYRRHVLGIFRFIRTCLGLTFDENEDFSEKSICCVQNDALPSSLRELVETRRSEIDQKQIYDNLMAMFAKLPHKKHKVRNFFINHPHKSTARYFAARSWNWRLNYKAKLNSSEYQFRQKTLVCTIRAMNELDIELVSKMLVRLYREYFPLLSTLSSTGDIKTYLEEKVLNNHVCTHILCKAIHNWFFIMPILNEMKHFISWDKLMQKEVYLLDSDVLYEIFLNIIYEKEVPIFESSYKPHCKHLKRNCLSGDYKN